MAGPLQHRCQRRALESLHVRSQRRAWACCCHGRHVALQHAGVGQQSRGSQVTDLHRLVLTRRIRSSLLRSSLEAQRPLTRPPLHTERDHPAGSPPDLGIPADRPPGRQPAGIEGTSHHPCNI